MGFLGIVGRSGVTSPPGSSLMWGAILAVALATSCIGCDKGPAQKAGEKVDDAVDRLTGKGPAEKAGESLDKAVDSLKK